MAREDDVRRIVVSGRERGLSDDQIRALVARYDQRAATAQQAAVQADASRATGGGSSLPALAESVGGLIGGVRGGKVGAAVGGAAGRGYGELAAHAIEIPSAVVDVARNLVEQPRATLSGAVEGATEGARNVLVSGVWQGALQAGGEGLVYGGGRLAKWLMNRATTRVSAQLAREFPELSDTLIDNALTVSKGGEAKARMLLKVAKGKANAALHAAEKGGATIPAHLTPEVADILKTAVIEDAIKAGAVPVGVSVASTRLPAPVQAVVTSIDNAVTSGTPLNLSPTQADLFKTALQKHSRALYLNRVAPHGPKAMSLSATEAADYATQLNTAIDAIAGGYKAANAEARQFLGAARGIKQSIRPSGNLYQAMVRPAVGAAIGAESGRRQGGVTGAVAGGAVGAWMTSPTGMSHMATWLGGQGGQRVLAQLPRATAASVLALLSGEQSAAQSAR